MKLLAEDRSAYRTGIGLLAVHSAISLSDAIMVGVTGRRAKYQDHLRAAPELEKACRRTRVANVRGIDHLRWLLGNKSAIAYEHRRLDDALVLMAIDKAEKFNSWAYNQFEEILHAQTGA